MKPSKFDPSQPGVGSGGSTEITLASGQKLGAIADAAKIVLVKPDGTPYSALFDGSLTIGNVTTDIAASLGTKDAGTAATKSMLIGGVYVPTATALTSGQQAGWQFGRFNAAKVQFMGADSTTGVNAGTATTDDAVATGGRLFALSAMQLLNDAGNLDRARGDTEGMFISPARRVGTNRSKQITNVSSEVVPANSKGWFLANDSAADIFINFGAPASATPASGDGSFRLAPRERLTSADIVDRGAINAVVANGTADLKARSW